MLKLKISRNNSWCVELEDASAEVHGLLRGIVLNNQMGSEDYRYSRKAGAFLQGGSNLKKGWIFIEFWDPRGAEDFVRYANKKIEELQTDNAPGF